MIFSSIDVSGSNIGYSEFKIIENQIELIEIKHFALDSEVEIFKRFSFFKEFISDRNNYFFIFEDRLKSFASGFTNKNALLSCAAANEICSYIVYQNCKNIFKFHPMSIRSSLGIKKGTSSNIKEVIVNYTINHDIFKNYLKNNNKNINEVFPQKQISKGKNKGQMVFLTGVEDMCDSFVMGIASINLLNKKYNKFYNEIFPTQ